MFLSSRLHISLDGERVLMSTVALEECIHWWVLSATHYVPIEDSSWKVRAETFGRCRKCGVEKTFSAEVSVDTVPAGWSHG